MKRFITAWIPFIRQSTRTDRFPSYLEWTTTKTLKPRRNGKTYVVSPLALIWDDENYYLAAYDAEADCIKHYRVDK